MRLDPSPQSTQSSGGWRLKRTLVRGHSRNDDSQVEQNPKYSKRDEDPRNDIVNGCHVSTQPAGEEEESDLEHHRKSFDEQVERPFLESCVLSLTVSTTLDHRPARVPHVSVQPLLPQHCDERREQRYQQAGVHETRDGDDLAGRVLLNGQNGGGFVWDCGLVEGEEDGAEEGHGLVVGVGLEFGMDVDDEGRADGREQTRLRDQVR